jgi:hypothetical protein
VSREKGNGDSFERGGRGGFAAGAGAVVSPLKSMLLGFASELKGTSKRNNKNEIQGSPYFTASLRFGRDDRVWAV